MYSPFGDRVDRLLEEKKMLKGQLAEKMGITGTALTHMLQAKNPNHRTLRKISEILGVEIAFFSDVIK